MTKELTPDRAIKVALLSCSGVGPRGWERIRAWKQIEKMTWQGVWEKVLTRGEQWGLKSEALRGVAELKEKMPDWENFEEELKIEGIWVILAEDGVEGGYPPLLQEIPDHPEILFGRGTKDNLLPITQVAMVGTRRATSYGRMAARCLAEEVVAEGLGVVSGFMYGIDVICQRAAHLAGGITTGVLGYGFNYCFPQSQKPLMEEMISQGQTMITEFPPWQMPLAGNFPARNRIVAGLSLGTVVVEAAAESGSLITANLAADYGREVMAVPGPIKSIYSEGTRALLKLGATWVGSGAEIKAAVTSLDGGLPFSQVAPINDQSYQLKQKAAQALSANLPMEQKIILENLSREPLGLKAEQLMIATDLTLVDLQSHLILLQLDGQIEQIGEVFSLAQR